MRNARKFVEEYRRKGYPDDRIRIIASMRPEPLRTEALKILDQSKPKSAEPPPEKDPESLALELPDQERAVEVAAAPEPVAAMSHDDAKELEALRAELADVRKEREEIASLLKRTASEVDRLRGENAEASELRARLAELESVNGELEEPRSQRQEVTSAKAEIEEKLADLKAKLKQKEMLLAEKDKMLDEIQASLQRERDEREERESVAARAESELSQVQEEMARLRKAAESKSRQVAEIETEMSHAREAAETLRRQMDTNEQAVSELQEKVMARESELESLREHFDREAKDLNKRAEQELWLIQRRLRRMHRLVGVGTAVAACLLVVMAFGYIGKAGQVSGLRADLAQAQSARPSIDTANASQDALSAPQVVPLPVFIETPPLNPAPKAVTTGPATPTVRQETMTPPAPSVGSVKMYTVQKDDSLWTIARQFLGKGERWKEIAEENNISKTNPQIKPGMALRIKVTAGE
jgi:nucleoid-associated protein YgaU